MTLESALGAGRMFLLDYKVLEGITVKNGYLTQPFCLLYADNQGRLRPVAIQLFQEKGPDAPVFTPRDPFWLWLTAKTFVQSADAAYHEVVAHLLHTHLVSETFAVATARRLHPRHPLHELMKPFFRFTMAINHGARTSMLAPGGAIHIATDWANYAEHIDEAFAASADFRCTERREHDGDRPLDRPVTKFERRGLRHGHRIVDWRFEKYAL